MVVAYYDSKLNKMYANVYEQDIKIKENGKWFQFTDEKTNKKVCHRLIYVGKSVDEAKQYIRDNYSRLKTEFPKWIELDQKMKSTVEEETNLW